MNQVLRKGTQFAVLTLFGVTAVTSASAAEYKLLVEPSYNVQRATEVYQPLVAYLSKATGHKITLVTSRNYHFFWRDVRQNAPVDFMFSEAHFTDFRAKRFQYEPIARTVENTSYTLLGSDQLTDTTLRGLINKNIVSMPSPSMGFAMLLQFFPDPVRQPNLMSTAQSWVDGVEIVFAGEADAAIVPTWLMNQYPNLIPIATSKEYPGAAMSAAPTVPPEAKQAMKDALLKLHEDQGAYEVLAELGVTQFIEASAANYDGNEKVLEGFFGYK
ncbi:MAG: PhnD/SsuA/transferrin family substrate-binding protein [Xanthomonadales bacterium]|nr:PhnD/SsuA/transferrin family substrate-binding protein [Xanthomonadales bacterium]